MAQINDFYPQFEARVVSIINTIWPEVKPQALLFNDTATRTNVIEMATKRTISFPIALIEIGQEMSTGVPSMDGYYYSLPLGVWYITTKQTASAQIKSQTPSLRSFCHAKVRQLGMFMARNNFPEYSVVGLPLINASAGNFFNRKFLDEGASVYAGYVSFVPGLVIGNSIVMNAEAPF